MKKKLYEKPTMKVVMLQQQTHLLAGSNNTEVKATMNTTWGEEDI